MSFSYSTKIIKYKQEIEEKQAKMIDCERRMEMHGGKEAEFNCHCLPCGVGKQPSRIPTKSWKKMDVKMTMMNNTMG